MDRVKASHARLGGPARPRPARPQAFTVDIYRTIVGNLKRFISLFVIATLGTTMLVGLKAACDDLRLAADGYYDDQNLYDIAVRSTLGLDERDIEALAALEGVEVAEGSYVETVYTDIQGVREKVDLKALSPAGLNEPLLIEGRLPSDADEVAVTRKYLEATGKELGDTVVFGATDQVGASSGVTDDTSVLYGCR